MLTVCLLYTSFPTSYGRLINNVFFQRAVPINTGEPANMAVKKWSKPVAADMYSIANPVTNYSVSYTHLDVYKRQPEDPP